MRIIDLCSILTGSETYLWTSIIIVVRMIGFQDEFFLDAVQENEDEKTRYLSKSQLYHLVAAKYFVPPMNSRGMTRDYLLKVWRNQVYSVEQQAMKAFEFGLKPEQVMKIGIPNSSYLVRKLNHLLQERGSLPLGFSELEVPDQKWLHRIARQIDKYNLTEFYQEAVDRVPEINRAKLHSHLVYHGRIHASRYFLSVNGIKGNKRFKEQLKEISDTYRLLCSTGINKEVVQKELELLSNKVSGLAASLDDMISKMAVNYTTIKCPEAKAESLLSQKNDTSKEVKDTLSESMQLIRYIYCSDNILDRNNPDVQKLTQSSLENERSQPPSSGPSAKASPAKGLK